jgi:ATP-dependent DNA helicase RecG
MRKVEQIIQKLEYYITNSIYESIETETFELKNQPANQKDKEYISIKETICSFLNTNGGILMIGIKEDKKNKKYIFNGYDSNFEESIKILEKDAVYDINSNPIHISEYIKFEIRDFLDGRILLVYVERLPHDIKFVFTYNKDSKLVAYERKMEGDHAIDKIKVEAQEEYKIEIQYAKELRPVINTTIRHLSVDKLNDYIYWINKEVKIESTKADIENAKSFLLRKSFITKDDEPTILGMLVCGEHPEDYLSNRCQVDCFVHSPIKIAQNKKVFKDNILPLLENCFGFIYRNIQIGISAENSGTGIPEYPENLIRECINNSLAHRDYTIDRFINIDIIPNKHIEIRNPGGLKKTLLIEETNHEIPLRRIIPNQKPVNPKLADVLKVFNKYEGKGIGMATLVNECLNDKIDIPYYKFRDENDISLVIQSGKLLDDTIENLLYSFSGFIENLTQGEELTNAQKHIIAYLYKSEKENENYRYTILLTPDNNHFDAIKSLEKYGLIYKHSESSPIRPIFILHRALFKENFNAELIEIFGDSYLALSNDYKECLKTIFKINKYSKHKTVSASQIGNILYLKEHQKILDIRSLENFKRKIRNVFNQLEKGKFIVKEDKKYFINEKYVKNDG